MPLDFPDPNITPTFSSGTKKWYWSGEQWVASNTSTENSWTIVSPAGVEQTFNSSTNWTVPAGVNSVEALVIGGGGGGNHKSGGGGGGGMSYSASYAVTPGAVIPVVVAATTARAATGGTSSFNGSLSARGGGGAVSFGAGGVGGTGNYANGASGPPDFGGAGTNGPVSPFDGNRYGGSGGSRGCPRPAGGLGGGGRGGCGNDVAGNDGTPNTGGGSGGEDGTGSTSTGGSGVVKIRYANNSYTPVHGDRIAANTTNVSFQLNLPGSPVLGTSITVVDHSKTWDTKNLIIGRNGSTIEGLAEDLVCNTQGDMGLLFLYDNFTWRVYFNHYPE